MDDLQYNSSKDAKQTWEKTVSGETVTGEVVEKIETASMPLVTVPGCKHEKTERKPSDELDGYDEVSCSTCPVGWFVKH